MGSLPRWGRLTGALPSAVAVVVALIARRFFLWRQKAQRKKLCKKEMPLLRALPEPARFFEKKRGKKLNFGADTLV